MFHRCGLAPASTLLLFWPLAANAADTIKISLPIPLSGVTAIYGAPVIKGAELMVAEINANGDVPRRKLELLSRDSKGNADQAMRLARELSGRLAAGDESHN